MINGINILASRVSPIVGVISPQSTNTTVTSAWVSMTDLAGLQAIIATGVLGASATVDAKLQQATDSGGTGAKDITGKAITQLVKATDDNKQAVINCRVDEMDINNNFTHVRLSITVGTAASLVSGLILGHVPRYDPLDVQAASVKQVV
jgi:hypothetical protein